MNFTHLLLGLTCFWLLTLPPAQAHEHTHYQDLVEMRRSQDHRSYKTIKLENGLEVSLVQDTRNKNAFASMNVGVGSLAEPQDQRGLAHFLEHLLFLGSEKFPDVDAYKRYLADNGGGSNAFTSREDTNYFFSISGNSLEGALDRFSQFFIAPLLDPNYVEREKNAIEKEYMRIVENDGWLFFRARMLGMNPEHPHAWYFPGNLTSLAQVTRANALDFYKKHYSASNMHLAIVGPQDLGTLETWARAYFSKIKNTGAKAYKVPDKVFLKDELPKKVTVQSFSPINQLALDFILPYERDLKSKSIQLVSSLIGSEVSGSLTSYLKNRGYIFSLSASGGDYENYNLLSISARLTQKGVNNKDDVVQAIFDYIKLMRENGIPESRLQREQESAASRFLEAPYASTSDFATSLTLGMKNLPGEDSFARESLIETINTTKINQIINQLRPENLLIREMRPQLSNSSFDHDYKLAFTKEGLQGSELITQLKSKRPVPEEMTLPQENPYFDNNYVMETDAQSRELQLKNSAPGFRSYSMQDAEFNVPLAQVQLKLSHKFLGTDPYQVTVRSLAISSLSEYVNEVSFAGIEAKYNFTAEPHPTGLILKFEGPSNRISLFIKDMMKRITQPMENDVYLILAKEQIAEEAAALSSRAPLEAAFDVLTLNLNNYPSLEESLPFASQISLKEVNQEVQSLLFKSFVETTLIGNLSSEKIEEISYFFQDSLVSEQSLTSQPHEPVYSYPTSSQTKPVIIVDKVRSENYGFLYWIGIENLSPSEVGSLLTISQFVSQQYFKTMRTEKGLAYAVGGGTPAIEGSGLLYLFIQSDNDISRLQSETLKWMPELIKKLRSIDTESFQTMRAGILSNLENPPQSFIEKWRQAIENWDLRFPRLKKQRRIELAKQTQLEDLLSLVEKLEQVYLNQSVTVGIWPESSTVAIPEGTTQVDKRL